MNCEEISIQSGPEIETVPLKICFISLISRSGPLRFDSVKLTNGSNLLFRPCLTLKTSITNLLSYRYPQSCT